eukprot:462519-Hanusia_phi.AAC.1
MELLLISSSTTSLILQVKLTVVALDEVSALHIVVTRTRNVASLAPAVDRVREARHEQGGRKGLHGCEDVIAVDHALASDVAAHPS